MPRPRLRTRRSARVVVVVVVVVSCCVANVFWFLAVKPHRTQDFTKWIDIHTSSALEGLPTRLKCANVENTFRELQQDSFAKQKVVLIHINATLGVSLSGLAIDDFTRNYVSHFLKHLQRLFGSKKVEQTKPLSFLVTSAAFGEQIRHPSFDNRSVGLLASCMTRKTSKSYGIWIPRPYAPREVLNGSTSYNDWKLKSTQVFFRGALSSSSRLKLTQKLNSLDEALKKKVDIQLTHVADGAVCPHSSRWCANLPSLWAENYNLRMGGSHVEMSMKEQTQQFRYILSVDGVGCADRLRILLGSSSVVLKQDSEYEEFWYKDIAPGKHYLRVDGNFDGFDRTLLRIQKRTYRVDRAIIRKANALVHEKLSHPTLNEAYLDSLLKKYSTRSDGCMQPDDALSIPQWLSRTKE